MPLKQKHVIVLIGILFLIKLYLARILNLMPDEAYYWSWSRDLSWCYYDQPGMIAWIEYLFTGLSGVISPLSARFPMILLSLGTTIAVYFASLELFGSQNRALIAAALINIIPIFFTGSIFVMHDSPLLFFWALSGFMFARFNKTKNPVFLYLLAVTTAGAVYSKFTGVFFTGGVFLFFMLSPESRKWLKSPHFWLAQALFALMMLPILQWNTTHDWAAFKAVMKLSAKSPSSFSTLLDYIFSYHAAQFILISPFIYIPLIFSLFYGVKCWLKEKNDSILICLVASVPVLIYFTYLCFRTRVQPNWPVFGYPMAMILMIELIGRREIKFPGQLFYSLNYWRTAVGITLFINIILVLHALFCLIPHNFEGLVKKDRLIKEFYGWPKLAEKVSLTENPGQIVMALRYQIASELEFYYPQEKHVFCLNDFGRGNQYDFENDYRNLYSRDVLLVSEKPIPPALAERFEKVGPALKYMQIFKGVIVKTYYLYNCYNYKDTGRKK